MKTTLKKCLNPIFFLTPVLFLIPEIVEAGGRCGSGGGFCWSKVGMGLGWIVVTSALVFFTWNHVFVKLFRFKKGTFWQAVLLIATVAAFCAPKYFGKGCHGKKGKCSYSHGKHKH